jgi:ribosomal protein L32E
MKFFRKIRQNLLTENKFSKYLLYAIGEIVLVVIGILIAVQINDWNNYRIEKKSDYQLIGALITDLKSKDREIISDLEYGKSLIKKTDKIVDNWAKNKSIDTLNLKFSIQILGNDGAFFDVNSPVLKGLTNSDLWKRFPDSLLRQIDDVYRGNLTGAKNSYDKITEYATQCKFRFLIPNGLTDTHLNTKEIQSIINKNKIEYISYLVVYRDGILLLNNRLKIASERINKLIENLNIYQSKIKK